MTKLEALKEAYRRMGDSPDVVESRWLIIKQMGLAPRDADAAIPAGLEEAEISRHMETCKKNREFFKTPGGQVLAQGIIAAVKSNQLNN